MLSDERRRCSYAAASAAHPPRHPAMLLHADLGMLKVDPVAALLEMGVLGHDLVRRTYRSGHAGALKDSFSLGGAALGGPGSDDRYPHVDHRAGVFEAIL